MALSLRTGTYGNYWGNDYNTSNALKQSQMEVNATYLYNALTSRGWSINAIAGILGNMQAESSINPGRWQGNNVGVGPAYGIVQWDPFTKYTTWALNQGLEPSEMDSNLSRIDYEIANNLQWIPTSQYKFSFQEFTKSTETPEYLASAFLKNYERAGVEVEEQRRRNARSWFDYLGGITPTPTPVYKSRKNNFKWVLYARKKRKMMFFK